MRKGTVLDTEIVVNLTLEREIGDFTAEYDIEASCDYFPAEGDGWNSPRLAESVTFACAEVKAVHVLDDTGEYVDPERCSDDLMPVGEAIELSNEEKQRVISAAWDSVEDQEDLDASLRCEADEERRAFMREMAREMR